jgi:hypothetical protein
MPAIRQLTPINCHDLENIAPPEILGKHYSISVPADVSRRNSSWGNESRFPCNDLAVPFVSAGRRLAAYGCLPAYGSLKAVLGLRLDQEDEYRDADFNIHRTTATPEREPNWQGLVIPGAKSLTRGFCQILATSP